LGLPEEYYQILKNKLVSGTKQSLHRARRSMLSGGRDEIQNPNQRKPIASPIFERERDEQPTFSFVNEAAR
jgi:hypothetical protein